MMLRLSDSRASVATLLKGARIKAALTQAEVAGRLGVPQSFVSKYESGERRLDVGEVLEICTAVGFPFVDFAADFAKRGHRENEPD